MQAEVDNCDDHGYIESCKDDELSLVVLIRHSDLIHVHVLSPVSLFPHCLYA